MKDKFFSKLDWAAFWTATLATFAVYFFTLGPSVGLEDSGELATAAAHLGVPHPPGYPFWTFCSWLFCKAFSWVTYMGHPTPAWAVSLCSATFGAFAAGFTAMLICRSAHDFISGPDAANGDGAQEGYGKFLSFGGGVGGALAFSLSPVEWSQSTIVEIYSLNAFFLMWVFLLSYRWLRKPSDKILWMTAFIFGLGLTNYQVLVFAIAPLAIIILVKNIRLFRDVCIYLVPVALTYQLLQIGSLDRADGSMQSNVIAKHLPVGVSPEAWGAARSLADGRVYYQRHPVSEAISQACPSTTLIVLALVLLVAGLVAAAVLRRRSARLALRTALGAGGASALLLVLSTLFASPHVWTGVTFALAPLLEPSRYVMIAVFVVVSVTAAVAAVLRTGDGEKVTDREPRPFLIVSAVAALVAVFLAASVPAANSLHYAGAAYPWAKSTFIMWVVVALLFALCAFTRLGLAFAIPVAGFHLAAYALLSHGALNGLTHPASWWFWWPVAWNFVLLALVWITLPNGRSVAGAAFFAQLGVSFYVYMPIVSDLRNPPMNWGYPRTWEGFKHAIMRGQYEAIGFQMPTWVGISGYFKDVMVQFTDVLVFFALIPFVAGDWIVQKVQRKAFWQWMAAAASCFLVMSVLLIGLANVKGDLQDGFIQKVKFISSHAMVALWIGYGLVFAGAALVRWWNPLCAKLGRRPLSASGLRRLALVLAVVTLAVAGVTPIVQNYVGDYRLGTNEIAFKFGGSEQNGHTFGWQFGAYQLEGAKAINAQLVADEEPLPDPEWPKAMEKSAIFFGGTDPGRFVPTYMIYSANYRPDVYLITQNALADDTYMSVERDLYGDEIWIPAKEDSADAFNIYVDEVQRGVRQANGDLKIENGRVQVTGALGVMEINGILTKMMFDHDRLRHAFYVEESYAIPWMYDYLSPHGLIMKLNAEKTPYDAKTAAKDADFWDWYTRRLLNDPMYSRDFAAQKSFSKLRAALAGLYQKQGRYRESAQAYREACLLYPASPEATFRYAQECLLPMRRYGAVTEMMDYTDYLDPENQRTKRLRGYVNDITACFELIRTIEPKIRANTATPTERLALADAFGSMGRAREGARLLVPLADADLAPGELHAVYLRLMQAGIDDAAERAVVAYLTKEPQQDPLAWIDLARFQFRGKRTEEARRSFLIGLQMDQKAVNALLLQEQKAGRRELLEIAEPFLKPRQPARPKL